MAFDIILLIIISISSFLGLYTGLIKISINFVSLLISITIGYYLYPVLQEAIEAKIGNKSSLALFSSLICYFIGLLCYILLNGRMLKFTESVRGGLVDRFLGIFAGLIRGACICLVIFITVATISSSNSKKGFRFENMLSLSTKNYPDWLKNSFSANILHKWSTESIDIIKMMMGDEAVKEGKQSNIDPLLDSNPSDEMYDIEGMMEEFDE